MTHYRLRFYQNGVQGFEPEYFNTFREAARAGAGFLLAMLPMPGHNYNGSMYAEAAARIVDRSGATEAAARINKVTL